MADAVKMHDITLIELVLEQGSVAIHFALLHLFWLMR